MTSLHEPRGLSKDEKGNTLKNGKGGMEQLIAAIDELKVETSQQLVKVGRRLNFWERKVIGPGGIEGEDTGTKLSSEVSEEGDFMSTDAYGMGRIDLSS